MTYAPFRDERGGPELGEFFIQPVIYLTGEVWLVATRTRHFDFLTSPENQRSGAGFDIEVFLTVLEAETPEQMTAGDHRVIAASRESIEGKWIEAGQVSDDLWGQKYTHEPRTLDTLSFPWNMSTGSTLRTLRLSYGIVVTVSAKGHSNVAEMHAIDNEDEYFRIDIPDLPLYKGAGPHIPFPPHTSRIGIPLAEGSIVGTVYEEDRSTPIAGARVSASPITGGHPGGNAISTYDGTYCIPNLPAGRYKVCAKALGRETQYYYRKADEAVADEVPVVASKISKAIVFQLDPTRRPPP
jgi:hypothetical protein